MTTTTVPQTDAVHWPAGRPRTPLGLRRGIKSKVSRTAWNTGLDRLVAAARTSGWEVVAVTGRDAFAWGLGADRFGVAAYFRTRTGRVVCLTADDHEKPVVNLLAVVANLKRLTQVLKTGGPGMGKLLDGLVAEPPAEFRQQWERERQERERRQREQRDGWNYQTSPPPPPPAPPPPRPWWEVLGAPPGASTETLKRIYRTLVLQHHPDRGGDPELMKRINAAWEQAKKARDL